MSLDGTSNIDGATTDGSTSDASTDDAGFVVHELPSPQCNDLTQHGSAVVPTANPASPPAQVPILTIPLGLYVLVSAVDYGGSTPIQPVTSSKTTSVFTATRQYYLSESGNGGQPQQLTLDWKVVSNRLIRTVLCAQSPGQVGQMVDYRIDEAPNGFIVYVPVVNGPDMGRTQAFRYTRMK